VRLSLRAVNDSPRQGTEAMIGSTDRTKGAGRLAAACAVAVAAQLCLASGASANTFAANPGSLGNIPDGTAGVPGSYGAPLNVTFGASGMGTGVPDLVAVTITASHSFVGDLDVVLIAPNGTTTKTILSRTGASGAGDDGDDSDLAGTYTFSDRAPAAPTWWAAAAGTVGGQIVGGSYRASTPGGPGAGANTTITPAFSAIPSMNGTWTLRVRDGAAVDTGAITAASLDLVGDVVATPGSLGQIPDGPGSIGTFGAPLNVTFPVSGQPTAAPASLRVTMTFSPAHTWAGDVEAVLVAPGGTEATIFSRTGSNGASDPGDNSNLTGPYSFLDGTPNSWWAAATSAATTDDPLAPASYRSSTAGGAPGGGATTSLISQFSGVTNPNGTWTLRFRDAASGDLGSVSAATLSLFPGTDSTAPAGPTFTASDPPSPSNSNTPKLQGNAEAGSTVRIYDDGFCTGLPSFVGTAAAFTGAGIPVTVPSDSPNTFSAQAYDTSGNVSGCTAVPLSYTEDSTPQALAPTLTQPTSPANNNFPALHGSGAEGGSTVKVFASTICDGPQLFDGTAAQFNGARIPGFEVLNDTSDTYTVNATDLAGNVSPCSNAITYVEDSTALAPTLTATVPASPSIDASPEVKGSGAEAGSTVTIYGDATCAGTVLGSGPAANFNGATGITATVTSNATTTLRATVTDTVNNVSLCSPTSVAYTHDSIAPSAPILVSTNPASPSNDDTIAVNGSAEAGSTVRLYGSADCSPPVAFTGTAAELAGAGIAVDVPENATTSIRATATDLAGNLSTCSAPITYVEDSTSLPPSLTATDPASPANENAPKVKGSAEAGSAVKLFTTSDCSGTSGATGTAAELAGAGIGFSVADNSTTAIRAVATDPVGNVSVCSAPISYAEVTPDQTPPQTSIGSKPDATVKTKGKSAAYSISFSANEAATFRCSLDGAAFTACASPATGKAKNGSHTFSVVATDTAGNPDPTPASATWKVKRKKRKH
jgi:subtilisin-like proprotein convertase family protein